VPIEEKNIIVALYEKQELLRHAVEVVDTKELNGRTTTEVYHYLTCVKCLLRKQLGLPEHTQEEILHGEHA
jgi:hypothetical protein